MFEKKLKIGENKKYSTSKVSENGITAEERTALEKKNKKLIDVFKAFDKDGDGTISKLELANAMDIIEKHDADGDKKISKKERAAIAEYLKNENKDSNLDIDAKSITAFLKGVRKTGKDDNKVSTKAVIDDYNKEQERIKQEEKAAEEARLKAEQEAKAKAEQEAKARADEEARQKAEKERLETPKNYTVQEGEKLKDLLKRSLEAQGIEPTEENLAKAKEEFVKNNPNALHGKADKEYLYAGDTVKIAGDLEDKGNGDEIKENYRKKQAQIAAEKRENAKYSADAYYRNKDGSVGRHIKLKPTGEKSINERYYAVDKQGNRYLVAKDGTILNEAKVAKKDAAVASQERAYGQMVDRFNNLVRTYNDANDAFTEKVEKNALFDKVSDGVAGFFGSKNTKDEVCKDLMEYSQKLDALRAAVSSRNVQEFNRLYKELKNIKIAERVQNYI